MPPKKAKDFKESSLPVKIINGIKNEIKYKKEKEKVERGEELSNLEKTHYKTVKKIHEKFYEQNPSSDFRKYINKFVKMAINDKPEKKEEEIKEASTKTEIIKK